MPVDPGTVICRVLAGAWRSDAPQPPLAAGDLATLVPRLLGSGAAALGWSQLQAAAILREAPAAAPLHDAARMLAIADALRERAIAHLAGQLNRTGVVPLLFKGWAVARHYAESYLRPYGDFDLLVRPGEMAAARAALARLSLAAGPGGDPNVVTVSAFEAGAPYTVDLHDSLPDCAVELNELFRRAEPVTLTQGQRLLVPCPEDHLRIVILHFLRHGGWRPLWLCDIAAMAESAGPDFDWELCRTRDPVLRSWIDAALGAAATLLGARVGAVIAPPPGWVTAALLREWDAPYAERAMPASGSEFRAPLAALRAKWPNPIRAAFLRGGPVPRRRPVWDQCVYCASGELPRALSRLFGRRWWRQLGVHLAWRRERGRLSRPSASEFGEGA